MMDCLLIKLILSLTWGLVSYDETHTHTYTCLRVMLVNVECKLRRGAAAGHLRPRSARHQWNLSINLLSLTAACEDSVITLAHPRHPIQSQNQPILSDPKGAHGSTPSLSRCSSRSLAPQSRLTLRRTTRAGVCKLIMRDERLQCPLRETFKGPAFISPLVCVNTVWSSSRARCVLA